MRVCSALFGALLVFATLAPPAGAGYAYPSCAAVTDPWPMLVAFYVRPVVAAPVTASGVQLWQEVNDVDGLQRSSCTTPSGQYVGSDNFVAGTPPDDDPY